MPEPIRKHSEIKRPALATVRSTKSAAHVRAAVFITALAGLLLGATTTTVHAEPVATAQFDMVFAPVAPPPPGTPNPWTGSITFDNQSFMVQGTPVNLGVGVGTMTMTGSITVDPLNVLIGTAEYSAASAVPGVLAFDSDGAFACDPGGCTSPANSNFTGVLSSVSGSLIGTTLPLDDPASGVYVSDGFVGCAGNICTGLFSVNFIEADATPAGSAVSVAAESEFYNTETVQAETISATVTYPSVSVAGQTYLVPISEVLGAVPVQFALVVDGYRAALFDLTTTATFSGTVEVCVSYADGDNDGLVDGTSVAEPTLRLLHNEGGTFVDRTSSQDSTINQVCGEVTSFSEFALAVDIVPCGNGVVDAGETCDSSVTGNECCNATCDGFEPGTTECRATAGECDVPEFCAGSGSCPVDDFESAGAACGSGSDTVCDDPDTCDGSGSCQDNFESAATVCRADAGECDVPELCDGTGSCPSDGFEPSGLACDADADVCTGDSCDGAGACLVGSSINCDDNDECTGTETCDPVLGCQAGMPLVCDDEDICTDDSCDAISGCEFVADPSNDPTCAPGACPATPTPSCLSSDQAKLDYSEKALGKEKMTLQWKKIATATAQGDFGDPVVDPTIVTLCIYDDSDTLVEQFIVDRGGQLCAGKDCWKAKSTKGYGYKDKDISVDGVSKMGYGSGDAGKGKADAKGKNNSAKGQNSLTLGVVAQLMGNEAPTIQMLTSDGFCVGATMTDVKKDDGLSYKAQKR